MVAHLRCIKLLGHAAYMNLEVKSTHYVLKEFGAKIDMNIKLKQFKFEIRNICQSLY